jgi:hypothetical protein
MLKLVVHNVSLRLSKVKMLVIVAVRKQVNVPAPSVEQSDHTAVTLRVPYGPGMEIT